MIWKTILVPHDFSSAANHAAAIARDEAKTHGARILLLHVIDLPHQLQPDTAIVPEPGGAPISVKDYAVATAESHLTDIAQRLGKDGATATGFIRVGNPVDEILRFIDDEKVDLVAMSTHGRTGLSHLLMGSVAERVVRSCKVPVLTIRAPEHAH
ncbi:MAG: universal stress protein [Acidobacteriota bacterium]